MAVVRKGRGSDYGNAASLMTVVAGVSLYFELIDKPKDTEKDD